MTGCFINLLSQLPNILKTNENHKDEKDLAKFAEDTNSHLFGEELEDLKKG